jgi:di/tricarboxylate transporter
MVPGDRHCLIWRARAGLVLEPLPTGAWAFLAVTAAVATKTLSFAQAFTAFQNDVIWLIVVSFFFAAVRYLCIATRAESA